MNIDFVQKKVLQTSEHFSLPSNYTAKNVVLTNGDYDPWSALRSDVNNETRHQFSKISHGSSHCADMLPTIPGDSADLLNLRDFVEKEVSYYLDSPLPTKSSSTRLFLSPLICFFILLSLIFIE
uniref:Uncharacterized protein n=1 Tax=Panagrolaimus davidi TaxID=227884 RepID=A0A914QNF4_9BILA